MIKVLVSGSSGKMGMEVINLLDNDDNFLVVGGFDRAIKNNLKTFTNIRDIDVDIDVIIDFSNQAATMQILEFAKDKKIPIVIATTGFEKNELKTINKYANIIPIFKAANMSFEINLMARMLAKLAPQLRDSDIEIIETHHNQKVDAPSGTALFLADAINKSLDNEKHYEYNRHDKKEKRDKKEIGIHAIRGGTVVGKHSVLFMGENEYFEITHTVESRSIFAKGAIKAAEFIIKQKPNLYDMESLLKDLE